MFFQNLGSKTRLTTVYCLVDFAHSTLLGGEWTQRQENALTDPCLFGRGFGLLRGMFGPEGLEVFPLFLAQVADE
jgi:hypothetical protein